MAKLWQDQHVSVWFCCPGCGCHHRIPTRPIPADRGGNHPKWTFNGDLDRPTLSPSIKATMRMGDKTLVCHSFVREGRIQFCGDSTHRLAGQTVELDEVDGERFAFLMAKENDK